VAVVSKAVVAAKPRSESNQACVALVLPQSLVLVVPLVNAARRSRKSVTRRFVAARMLVSVVLAIKSSLHVVPRAAAVNVAPSVSVVAIKDLPMLVPRLQAAVVEASKPKRESLFKERKPRALANVVRIVIVPSLQPAVVEARRPKRTSLFRERQRIVCANAVGIVNVSLP